jgi:hypothetical protein
MAHLHRGAKRPALHDLAGVMRDVLGPDAKMGGLPSRRSRFV